MFCQIERLTDNVIKRIPDISIFLESLEIYSALKLGFSVDLNTAPSYVFEICNVLEQEQQKKLRQDMELTKIKGRL